MAIYLLWGATFLAIRVAVLAIPPFLTAGLRFFIAGLMLYGYSRWRGEPRPSLPQWRGIAVTAVFMFAITYGALFWAEQYVPSGLTAVLEASLPIIAMLLEVFIFRRQPFSWRMLLAITLGFVGVLLLLLNGDGRPANLLPCLVILGGSVAWTLGAVLTRSVAMPRSVPLSAGAQMMIGGLALLLLALFTGELVHLPHVPLRAALALIYLIVGGSLIAYTSYAWLLTQMSATRVFSHAYINPLVAVALGYFWAGEQVTPRMLIAAGLVVISVFLILARPASPSVNSTQQNNE